MYRDVWLAVRVGSWLCIVGVAKHLIPVARLAALMWSDGSDREPDPASVQRIAGFVRRLSRPGGNCLARSLVLYRFLSREGADPRLTLGLRQSGTALVGHAWVTVGDLPVLGPPPTTEAYVPVVSFGRGGCAEHGPEAPRPASAAGD
jgi:hypothetical protein